MTVSLALRNSREVSVATRKRIQKLAHSLGYRPDPTITKLMHHLRLQGPARFQASLCALTQTWPKSAHALGTAVDRLREGLRQRAESLGYAFDTVNIDAYPQPAQLQRVLVSRGIEGLVVLPMVRPCDLSRILDWEKFSTVSVTSSVIAPRFHCVVPHHFDNMLHVCRQLTRRGARRIGLALSEDWDLRVNHRWVGGMAWHNLVRQEEAVPPFIGHRPGPNMDPADLADWVARERPDVIVTDTMDRTPIDEALRTLKPRRRPKVVTLNWPFLPADSGLDQCVGRVGEVAIEVLAGMITRGEKGIPAQPNTTMVDGVWVEGRPHP